MTTNSPTNFVVDSRLFASKGQRILNYLIDIVFIYVSILVVTILISVAEIFLSLNYISTRLEAISEFEGYVVFFVFFFTYYILLEFYIGRTVAKLITGTLVVLKNGSKPSFSSICLRTFFRIIPFDSISFLGNDGSGMHDTFSKTYVVKKTIFEQSFNSNKELHELGKND